MKARAGAVIAVVVGIAAGVIVAAGLLAAPGARAATAATVAVATAAACRAVLPGSMHVLSAVKGRTPVVMVHGFSGVPADFTNSHQGAPSMATRLGQVPGVAPVTFDYSKHALEWVTDKHIGPALAAAIVCLAERSGHHVVLVGHSMGGLAIQYAQAQTVAGTPVASVIDRIVTIGTPSTGSQLLSLAGGPTGVALNTVVDGARGICGGGRIPAHPTRSICDLLGAQKSPAVQGLTPGSSQLGALPAWDPHLVVHAIAGDLSLFVRAFGLEQSASIGDILVSVDSATADASKGETPLVVECRASLTSVTSVVDGSACSHGQLLRNQRIITDVRGQVAIAVHDDGTRA